MNIDIINVADQLGVPRDLLSILGRQGGTSLLAAFNTEGITGTSQAVNGATNINLSISLYCKPTLGDIGLYRPAGAGGETIRKVALSQVAANTQIKFDIGLVSGTAPAYPGGRNPGVWGPIQSGLALFETVGGVATNFNYTVSARIGAGGTPYTVMSGNVSKA